MLLSTSQRVAAPFTNSARPVCRLSAARAISRVQNPSIQLRASVAARAVEEEVDFPDAADAVAASESQTVLSGDTAKLRIRLRGYDKNLLADAVEQLRAIADATGALFAGPVMLPTRKRVYCVLRSPHVDKDAREHFEVRTHHRLIDLKQLSQETVAAMMQWVPPAGLEVECKLA